MEHSLHSLTTLLLRPNHPPFNSFHKMVMLSVSDEIESVDLENQIVRPPRQRRYGIRRRRRHEILFDGCCLLVHGISSLCRFIYQLLRKCNKTEAFLVVLEIVSLILAVVGKNKWNFLLAASVVSLLACVTTIMLCARRSTDRLAEKILMAVDIGFSLIQLVTTLIYFGLAIMHKRIGFNESLLPLYFALTRYVFAFFSSSRPRDSPRDSLIAETRSTGVTNPDPPTSQIVPGHEVTSLSSCETHSSQAASASVDNQEGLNPFSAATQMPTTDNEAKVDDPSPNFKVTDSSSCELLSSPDASTTVDIHGGLNPASPATQILTTDNEAKVDDPSPDLKVTGSSSCELLSSPAALTRVDIHGGLNPSSPAAQMPTTDNEAKVDDPSPNFKVTCSSSCKLLSSPTASTKVDIHGVLSHSTPAPHMSPTDNEAKGDGPLPNFKVTGSSSCETRSSPTVSTTVPIREGSSHSTPALQLPPTDNEAKIDDPFLNFKATNSSSCKPLNLSLDSISNDPSSTAFTVVDIHEELSQSSPATQMPQTDDEAKVDDQLLNINSMQSVPNMGGSMSCHGLNYTDSSSSEHQQLSSGSFTSGPTDTTIVHSHEPLNHAQTDPTDNDANGNECLLQDFEESYVTSELTVRLPD